MLELAQNGTTQRAAAIAAAYEATLPRLPRDLSLDEFSRATAAWNCYPVNIAGQTVGAVLVNGPEVHACIKPDGFGLWLSRRALRIVDSLIDRFGFAVTRAGTQPGRDFVQRLGFMPTDDASMFVKGARHGH